MHGVTLPELSGVPTTPTLEKRVSGIVSRQRSFPDSCRARSENIDHSLYRVSVSNRFERFSDFPEYCHYPSLSNCGLEIPRGETSLSEVDPMEYPLEEQISENSMMVHKKSKDFMCVGVWNVNSIDDKKYEYIQNFLDKPQCSFAILTEMTSESSDTIFLLDKLKAYCIVSCDKNRRVGLIIPKFWKDNVEVVDSWRCTQDRKKRISNVAVQATTYRLSFSTKVLHVTGVYIVPDASLEAKLDFFRKKSELEINYPNYMSLGDYNMDAKKAKVREFFKCHAGGLTQIVKQTTRKKTRMVKGKKVTSETTIDLAFLSQDAKSLIDGPVTTHKDAPSDHYLVEFRLNVKVPLKFVVKEYYLDPTRRPPIPKGKLQTVLDELQTVLEEHEHKYHSMTQSEIFTFVAESIRVVLDKHNPLNKEGLLKKRIYRFTFTPEIKKLQTQERHALNEWRAAKRNKSSDSDIKSLRVAYCELRNTKNHMVRAHRNAQQADKLYKGINSCTNVWDIIRKFLPDPSFSPPIKKLTIKGMSGIALANHMAKFFLDRAHLVSDEEAEFCSHAIPYPKGDWSETIEIDDSVLLDVRTLFKSKKKPTLAAGPDTISHRHVMDLMPVIEKPLNLAVNKPLDAFPDITTSYTRLLSKENKPCTVFTEKSQRPISELNILPKYGSIKNFVGQLRDLLTERMSSNQFAFPGKGGPLATVRVLDRANLLAKSNKKVLIVLWDFSNAFCTTIHSVVIAIARKFRLSEHTIALLEQFLEQSFSVIKMSDNDGYYLSEMTHTGRGDPQGQIGSDFVFAMSNDGMDPEAILDEIIDRVKYVDDFTDVYAADNVKTLFASLRHNEKLLKNQATSVGLKLNMDKLKILPMNIADSELDPEYRTRGPKGTSVYAASARFLGFDAKIKYSHTEREEKESPLSDLGSEFFDPILYPDPVNLRKQSNKKSSIDGSTAGLNLISRLNQAMRTIATLRKFEKSIEKKVTAATNLVWSNCYDIGLILAYTGEKSKLWKQICVSIRKLVKTAGLDYMLDSDTVYQVSTKMSPILMAKKQILQAGIKSLCKDQLSKHNYRVQFKKGDDSRPFWNIFIKEFNALEVESRKFIVDNLDATCKKKSSKIKNRLKSIYRLKFDPNGPISTDKRKALLTKNLYSRAKVQKRKRDAEDAKTQRSEVAKVREEEAKLRLLKTPTQRRKAHSTRLLTPPVVRQVTRCFAPVCEPPHKRYLVAIDDPELLCTLFDDIDLEIESNRRYEHSYVCVDGLEQPTASRDPKIKMLESDNSIMGNNTNFEKLINSPVSPKSPVKMTHESSDKVPDNTAKVSPNFSNNLDCTIPIVQVNPETNENDPGLENSILECLIFLRQIAFLNRSRPPDIQ